jgi:hypothetical protein
VAFDPNDKLLMAEVWNSLLYSLFAVAMHFRKLMPNDYVVLFTNVSEDTQEAFLGSSYVT